MHARLTILLAALLAFPLLAQEGLFSPGFAAKLASLGTHRTIQGAFTQTRHVASLGMDVTFHGEMAAERNGRLLWKVNSPLRYACVMTRDRLMQWDGETNRVLEVSAKRFPWLALIYDCQAAWISGDVQALQKLFQIHAREEKRVLLLTPKTSDAKAVFRQLELTFAEDFSGVASILLHEPSGDTLRIVFPTLQTDQPIPPERWQLPPP